MKMSKKALILDEQTGEMVEAGNRYDSQADYTPRYDAEVNSGEFIIDDTDYISLEDLIQRTKRVNPRQYNAIMNGSEMDSVELTPEEVQDYITNSQTDADDYRPSDNDVSEGAPETPTSQEGANPAANNPDNFPQENLTENNPA